MDRYEVLVGMDYRPDGDATKDEVRAEVGDVVANLPPQSIAWLLRDDCIRPAPAAGKKKGA